MAKIISQKNKTDSIIKLIQKSFNTRSISTIKNNLKNKPINIVTEALEKINDFNIILFTILAFQSEKSGELFLSLDDNLQSEIINKASTTQLKLIFRRIYPDDILDIINNNQEKFKKIFLSLDAETRQQVKQIKSYDKDEAGSIMNPEFFALNQNWNIKESIYKIKKNINNVENQSDFYVVDENDKLTGYIKFQDIIFADNYESKISSIMEKDIVVINQKEDVENVIDKFQDYSLESMPVVNSKYQLIGIITDNDILPALHDEMTEDIYNMYGITELEHSYIKSSIWKIVKSRIFWLTVLMLSSTLTSILISVFDQVGSELTSAISTAILIPILPVMTGTSGNAGSQSAASAIMSLAIGEITIKNYKKVFLKELSVGVILGGLLALINFVRLVIFFAIPYFRPKIENPEFTSLAPFELAVIVSLAVSLTLWLAIILAKEIGVLLPLLALKLKQDPSVMAMPLIATSLDAITTTLLFGIGIGAILLTKFI